MENISYLFLSVSLSAGRNIMSKKTAFDTNKKSQFFLSQNILFAAASLLLFACGKNNFISVSAITLVYGIIYGIFLILSQWMFTLALKTGNTSVCSVIYSLGFILPTVSGTLFWDETMSFPDCVGVLLAVIIILLTTKKSDREAEKKNKSFIPFILTAMFSSGGLGVMQKVQQTSKVADEKTAFLFVAFAFAFFCSFIALLFSYEKVEWDIKKYSYPAFTGLCFGGANLCNTILAGKMKSAVFFPMQNISTILLTALLGIVVFKEKFTIKTTIILMLGMVVIFLFSW